MGETQNKLNRIESPEIDPHIYSQLISDKAAEAFQWRKEQCFQQMVLEHSSISMENKDSNPNLTPYQKKLKMYHNLQYKI